LPVPTSSIASLKPCSRSRRRHVTIASMRPPKRSVTSTTTRSGARLARSTASLSPVVAVGVEVEGLRRQVDEQQRVGRKPRGNLERALGAEDVELVHAPDLLGHVEGLGGARQAVRRVRPGQRLDAQQRASVEVPDRLVNGRQAVVLDQPAQGVALVRRDDDDVVADVLEVRGAAAAEALGLVQGRIGLGPQHVRGLPGPQRRDADADRRAAVGEVADEPADGRPRAPRVGGREEDGELVAADAVRAIAGAPPRRGRRPRGVAPRRRAGARSGR
jgi:hypothetical protein